MDGYDAVVYDLDGTLVELAVDWELVAAEVIEALTAAGIEATGIDLWDSFDYAEEADLRDRVESVIQEHEREGAHESIRLPLADRLEGQSPVGVCSLNCEDACRIALETHALEAHVDAVIGRDSVPTRKPDPEPLLATLEGLDVPPENAVFVGDSERDQITAERAGTAFVWVEEIA